MARKSRPSVEEVLKYAQSNTKLFIQRYASTLPAEQREEILQEAAIRILQIYSQIDPRRGYKEFVQIHSRGAVLDYVRARKGFPDRTIKAEGRQWQRIEIKSGDSEEPASVDDTAGAFGVWHKPEVELDLPINPNWPLLARMAVLDIDLHVLCKSLLGFTQQDIACQVAISLGRPITRERMSQRTYELIERLDSPIFVGNHGQSRPSSR